MPADTEFTFKDSLRELWAACGELDAWRSGLTERLLKRLVYVAAQGCDDFNQDLFDAAVINYSRRELAVRLGAKTCVGELASTGSFTAPCG